MPHGRPLIQPAIQKTSPRTLRGVAQPLQMGVLARYRVMPGPFCCRTTKPTSFRIESKLAFDPPGESSARNARNPARQARATATAPIRSQGSPGRASEPLSTRAATLERTRRPDRVRMSPAGLAGTWASAFSWDSAPLWGLSDESMGYRASPTRPAIPVHRDQRGLRSPGSAKTLPTPGDVVSTGTCPMERIVAP